MAQRTIFLPDIGEVVLAKRRGARNIRLSITPAGKVRIGLPTWAPYAAGLTFAKTHSGWIQTQLAKQQQLRLQDGDLVGKYHRLNYRFSPEAQKTSVRLKNPEILVISDLPLDSPRVQEALLKACDRALRSEAENLLPQRLRLLAGRHDYSYKDVQIRKLTSRWGSCSSNANIRLSYYLVQLPWHLIDYVLVHELVHTKYLSHNQDFWGAFTKALPEARKLQKQIRTFQPRLIAVKTVA